MPSKSPKKTAKKTSKKKAKIVYRNVVNCPNCNAHLKWLGPSKRYECKCGKFFRLVGV